MFEPTPEQQAVISAERGNILVSAAAGSGKTAVLTDRIVSRIVEGKLDVQHVLVMTFTEAAARNMKDKIEDKLRAALEAEQPAGVRQRILRQLSWLTGARISTIHAFCLDVIRNFYHCLTNDDGSAVIEPGFSVDDGVEAGLLLREALEEYMTAQYERLDRAADGVADDCSPDWRDAFYRLVDGYGGAKSDQPLRELILNQFLFLRSLPDYDAQATRWLADLKAAINDFSKSPHMAALIRHLELLLDRALEQHCEMRHLLNGGIRFIADGQRNQAYHDMFGHILNTLENLRSYLDQGAVDWDEIRSMTSGLESITLPRASKNDSDEKKRFMELFLQHAAEVVHHLSGSCGTSKCSQYFIYKTEHTFGLPASQIQDDLAAMLPSIQVLFELVLGLDNLYSQKKQALGLIDFSDFEHLAIAILRQPEVRAYYRRQFHEIYVDEYQDTSSIQEEIISQLADDNCLMVGDIKQSIYRFRHAKPKIFMDKTDAYRTGEQGMLCELNKNFRSVSGILSATNYVFYQLMSKGAGEIDYDDHQALIQHRGNPIGSDAAVTLLLVNRADDNEVSTEEEADPDLGEMTADLDRYQVEALAAVAEMKRLRQQGIPWGDMAILTRTRSIGQACRKQLEQYAIPVTTDMPEPYLDMPIVRQMESLIHLLDNFRQDIPLASVMRSGLFDGGFSDEELARIRMASQSLQPPVRYFHEAIRTYAASGDDSALKAKVHAFLDWIGDLRDREQVLSLGELIGAIYEDSGWLDRLAVLADGPVNIRRLIQFRTWAEAFEARRPRGLHAFAAYLTSLHERGKLELPVQDAGGALDAVSIMTIHGSKGLEFPVVFLLGTAYNLTPKDTLEHLLVSETLGLGMDYVDPQRQIRYPTHFKLAMVQQLRAQGLAEELRLLYVAMTRAMDRLILIGSVSVSEQKKEKRLARLVNQAQTQSARTLPDYLVLAGSSYLDWLLMALAREQVLDWGFLQDESFEPGQTCFDDWRVVRCTLAAILADLDGWQAAAAKPVPDSESTDTVDLLNKALGDAKDLSPVEADLKAAVKIRMLDHYRFDRSAKTPLKLTVSEIKRREQKIPDEDRSEDGVQYNPRTDDESDDNPLMRGVSLELNQWQQEDTAIAGEISMDAGRLGTLLHAFFRYLDLQPLVEDPSTAQVEKQISRMCEVGMIQSQEATVLKGFGPEMSAFAASGLARAMLRAEQSEPFRLYREMPFTLSLPASAVYPDCTGFGSDDSVLVQGMVDCWFEDDSGITLVDYKSDQLRPDPEWVRTAMEKRYRIQLDYYARAVSNALGKPVDRCLIWLIRQGRAIEVKI